jgi:hypothetical protein
MPARSTPPQRALHLYRALLRTLPKPISPQLRTRIRTAFAADANTNTNTNTNMDAAANRVAAGEQFAAYLRAQRAHAALLARYNPGLDMADAERVRLSARRVGLDLPVEGDGGGEGR